MGKKISKHISFFDYFDKSLIVFSMASGGFLLHPLQQLLEHL